MGVQRTAPFWGAIRAVGVVAVFGVISGCGQKASEGFNNALADLQAKLTAVEKKVEDAIEWPPNDPAKGPAAGEEFRATVAEARARFDALKLPEGEAGKKFHAGFNEYLKSQEEAAPLYTEYLSKDSKPSKEAEVGNREAIDKMRAKRTSLALRLNSLQQDYVREAGLRLNK